jgi:CBS domain-containing protein
LSFCDTLWQGDLAQIELAEPLSVVPDAPLRQVIEAMQQARTGCMLICRDGHLEGIFTERDLVKRVFVRSADLNAPVSAFMTPDPVTIRRTDPVGLAIRTMKQGGYRRLPVVNAAGEPIGIASAKRIVRFLVDHFPLAVYNLPPQPRQAQAAREGA